MLSRREALAASLIPFASRIRAAAADPTDVFPAGKGSPDPRLGKPKTLNDYFPFEPPATLPEWESRKKDLREQVLVANGLWPMPEKVALAPVVTGTLERDGYAIDRVYITSLPGHYVTGNLYRPTTKSAEKRPAVLFAHGHWKDGRLHDAGEAAAATAVKTGAEPELARGRFFMQAIPVTLARRGYVVFQYDMVGYADSTAIPHILKSGVPHPEGFADAMGELRLQSLMGLQTWNGIRALDFLASQPDVDPKRIGMTGASGGGTQTFLLAAIDDRIAVAAPAVMVSTAMQGGCVCENCSLLRVGTGNVELAGLIAPRPLALTAANDWTKELLTKGYPDLQKLYRLYDAAKNVTAKAWPEFPHNYNHPAREFVYSWFAQHLEGKPEAVIENLFEPTPVADLRVFDPKQPRPKDELGAAALRGKLTFAADAAMAKCIPGDAASLAEFRKVVGTALRAMVVQPSTPEEPTLDKVANEGGGPGEIEFVKVIVGRKGSPERIPAVGVKPADAKRGPFAIWLHPKGKESIHVKKVAVESVAALLKAGFWVAAPDLLRTGEQTGEPAKVNEIYSGFTYGYNRTLFAERVRDVLAVVNSLSASLQPTAIHLVGWESFGPIAVVAAALAGDKVAKVAADLNGFRFEDIQKPDDPMMLPGAVKYGGLGAFLGLCAPKPVLVHNNKRTGVGRLSKAAYKAAGVPNAITVFGDKMPDAKVVEWLIT